MDFVILIAFGLLMYLVLFLPQQRRAKEHKRLIGSLGEGDEVLTNSGIFGFVNAVDDEVIWLEVADGVELRVAKSSVANKVSASESETADTETDEDADA